MNKYSQLSHTHFQYRIWRNELEMMQHETDFFLNVIEEIGLLEDNTGKTDQNWFINQFHHFQRLIKQIQRELSSIEKELAEGVLHDNILDKEQRLNHEYLKEEMDYFEQDYRSVKVKFRTFIANSETIAVY
jgi:t-SNARE complex subunit (syntaxin)